MKKFLSFISVVAVLIFVYFYLQPAPAPVTDGSFITYRTGETVTYKVEFFDGTEKDFSASAFVIYDNNEAEARPLYENVPINDQLKRSLGVPLGVDAVGPIWVSPKLLKEGEKVGGEPVDEIKDWNRWRVGVIRAGTGFGLSGEWYYDVNTGFLVGGKRGFGSNAYDISLENSNILGL